MCNYRDAKTMAATLRRVLQAKGLNLSHGECLEIVARQFGLRDWNVLAARLGAHPAKPVLPQPTGWFPSGRGADLYEMGIDLGASQGSRSAAVIRSRFQAEEALYGHGVFATLMQSTAAERYRGERIALEADLRASEVRGTGAIWFRVDKAPGQILAFDNMEGRTAEGPLVGSQDWTTRRVVLDVAGDAMTLNYGFMLCGTGSIWAANVRLTRVSTETATTDRGRRLDEPSNLDFSRFG